MKNLPEIDFKQLFESLHGLYLILMPDLTIVAVSDTYANATMTKRDEIIGKGLFEVFPDNPDDKSADGVSNLRQSLNYVLRNKAAHTMAVQKYDIRKPNGEFEVRYWSPVNKPVLNDRQEVICIIHRVEDVTEFVKMKNEQIQKDIFSEELQTRLRDAEIEVIKRSKDIQKMNAELEDKVTDRTQHLKEANELIQKNNDFLLFQKKQLEDFCNIISHNLRGPLVNIGLLVDLLSKSNQPADQELFRDKLNISVNNLNEIFNELVESLQVQKDTEIEFERLILKNHIQKALDGLQGEINKSQATFELLLDEAPEIYFPSKYLTSILHNLISNTLKYQSPERVPVVKIQTRKNREKIILSVSDNGLGIDLKQHANNLFKIRKVFHQLPNSKGFGLFITKSQIEAMGGRIWAESAPGEGSTFFVEFTNQNI